MNSFLEILQNLNSLYIYVFLIISSFIENVFPPWPGDTFIVFSGFLIYHNIIEPIYSFISIIIGNFLGAYIMYFLGTQILLYAHKIHEKIKIEWLKKQLKSLISEEQFKKTQLWFNTWGIWFVIFSRFSAGIRFFVSIIAGITKMNLFLFSICFFIGLCIWNVLLMYGGFTLGKNWSKLIEWLRMYNTIITIVIFILIFIFILYKRKIKKQKYNV